MTTKNEISINDLEKVSGGLIPPIPKEVSDKIKEEREKKKQSGGTEGSW